MNTQRQVPTPAQADALLLWAEAQNTGPWADHCRTAGYAARTIAEACGMDGDTAYAMGLLHDIGRYEGVRGLHHAWAGYTLLCDKGYPEAARICLTHSFPVQDIAAYAGGDLDCTDEEMHDMTKALGACVYDHHDRLVQLCDALSLPQGVCSVHVRLVDVVQRHGFNAMTLQKWDAFLACKAHFDALCGHSIYKLFDDLIIE